MYRYHVTKSCSTIGWPFVFMAQWDTLMYGKSFSICRLRLNWPTKWMKGTCTFATNLVGIVEAVIHKSCDKWSFTHCGRKNEVLQLSNALMISIQYSQLDILINAHHTILPLQITLCLLERSIMYLTCYYCNCLHHRSYPQWNTSWGRDHLQTF